MDTTVVKTKFDYVMQLRRCTKMDTFDKMVAGFERDLVGSDLFVFRSAVDHRLAELATGRYYENVPKEVWRLVK
ncbi:Hha/YmoA family nucleoid-associated regulatory protein [Acerihabitans sp. TG2]|uniref:Hha/YmoA family nucleoid-associated regulatory protein n=1 Tax=Acerihabitans sp. TG2 TaxID=3096008 RepID=UPI002B22466E|nr:Hha/YmoA family nucleoid-associated regulatory protein [Acerihabitans sp. TG2]MEA9392171.1 Hha/YmoA family nucleoid-associated regulatory protein [Acerihabitans sp. TG2]